MERRMHFNRPSVIIVATFICVGIIHNYLRTEYILTSSIVQYVSLLLVWITWVILYTYVGLTVINWKWSVREWGFTLDRRLWISLAFVLGYGILRAFLLSAESYSVLSLEEPVALYAIIGTTIEELIFRIFLILSIIKLFEKSRWKIVAAILISTLIFTAVHIPSKTPNELIGIFISSIVLGYVVVVTKSVLAPVFFHAVANTAFYVGLTGGIITIAAYFLVAGIGPSIERKIWE